MGTVSAWHMLPLPVNWELSTVLYWCVLFCIVYDHVDWKVSDSLATYVLINWLILYWYRKFAVHFYAVCTLHYIIELNMLNMKVKRITLLWTCSEGSCPAAAAAAAVFINSITCSASRTSAIWSSAPRHRCVEYVDSQLLHSHGNFCTTACQLPEGMLLRFQSEFEFKILITC